MNTFIQFINRRNELDFLTKQTEKEAAFIVIYGRRRVGKSELIKQFIKERRAIYLQATQEVEKELMSSFSKEIADHFGDYALKTNPYSRFVELMDYLKEKELKDLILVVDEFPYLVDSNKATPSILQKCWDQYLKQKGLTLILCGSSIGAMETEVLGRKSPLYGRRTGQWKLDPLQFKDFIKFFPKTSFENLVEFYSITGGIPLYVIEFDGEEDTYDNAKKAIADRGSLLYQETDIILKEELREPKTYFSLLKEISAGKNTLNELSNALGVERTALVRYIDILIELDLVEVRKPVTAKETGRISRYALKDNYFKFWFNFIYPYKKSLDSLKFDMFRENFKQNFNSYVGKQFESVCRQAIEIKNPIKSDLVGTWWGSYREDDERKEHEIDIVSINKKTNTILFGECKWKEKVDTTAVLKKLKEKAVHVQWGKGNRSEHFVIFAKSFTDKKRLEANVIMFDLGDLEKIFHSSG